MYKSELARKYNMSVRSLARLLNHRYYEELAQLGYKKTDQFIQPLIVRKFFEIWGEPLNENDL